MFRSHTNGELSLKNLNEEVTLSGWVQTIRDKGFMIWIDLRDRYGITQLVLDEDYVPKTETDKELFQEMQFFMYAVFETGGKQYRAVKGKIVRVEKLPHEEGQLLQWAGIGFSETGMKKVVVHGK